MLYSVRVVPRAKKEEVIEREDGSLRVKVRAPALEGRANQRLIELLARHFQVSKNCVRIVRGEQSRDKVIEII